MPREFNARSGRVSITQKGPGRRTERSLTETQTQQISLQGSCFFDFGCFCRQKGRQADLLFQRESGYASQNAV